MKSTSSNGWRPRCERTYFLKARSGEKTSPLFSLDPMTDNHKDHQGGDYTLEYLHRFVAEQVRAGLYKSNIIEKLLEMGVGRELAGELVDDMERKLKGRMRRRRVLVVEDEPHTRMRLEEILRTNGFAVYQAEDGARALEMMREADPDLIITDVLMPRMTGSELIKKLRETVLWRDVPLIVLSERGPMKDYFDVLNVAEFIEKPFTADALLGRIKKTLSRSEKRMK